ncbi:MAG: AMP-binding protein, partial [Candidatus Aminicenantes bacterium]|nr:AMP-binding protein [Candidatus Aminicenantes bacterium]NIM84498.1 AMP-binding protein [Candidatus Aminicenantes bacterium]NIN21660.1 AMP-binding protein [Candidatus Aminicenantes bacterium]NIN47733.1 AMP-binding protein [Candidatus Aminicenantes bacterium]NIN88287.1 AMP-binding protein [Candidatus Aminicenantes bacterium]
IVRHKITHFISIPTLYQGIIENLTVEETFSLKVITLAGDNVLPHVIEMTKQKNQHLEIVIEYGVTECAVMSTIFRHQEREDIIKLGKPIWNTCIYILGKYHHLQPIGAAGELCISGVGLARGYLNKPELTAEKFILVHSSWLIADRKMKEGDALPDNGSRNLPMSYELSAMSYLYKTGDLACWRSDGNIEFLGRIDYQVKIRGFRIELGEIENQLLDIEGISEAVVIEREDKAKTSEKYLCAYIVSASEMAPQAIKAALSRTLPGYMIPAFIVRLERMPLIPSGKVDRKALPVPEFTTEEPYAAPSNEIEEKLVEIWSEVLNINQPSIGIGDNFFELGGHSLKAAVMIASVEQIFNIKVPLVEVFRAASIRELGAYIQHKYGQKGIHLIEDKKLVMLREGKKEGKAFHLFFIHDGAGEVEAYIEFCQYINVEWNCWGIRALLFQNENIGPQNITIEKLARQYIDSITAVQPLGPYYIAGWSLGGTIAFEIVRQLEKKNETVSVFGLFDSPPPNRSLSANTFEFTFESELNFGLAYLPDGEIKEKIENLSTIHRLWMTIIDYLEENRLDLEFIKKAIPGDMVRSIPNVEQLGIRQLIHYFNIIRSFDRARTLYIPSGKIDTTIHYFAARESRKIRKEDWNCYCSQPVMAYEINGDHYSIFNIPEVVSFAKKFNETILESINTNFEE